MCSVSVSEKGLKGNPACYYSFKAKWGSSASMGYVNMYAERATVNVTGTPKPRNCIIRLRRLYCDSLFGQGIILAGSGPN